MVVSHVAMVGAPLLQPPHRAWLVPCMLMHSSSLQNREHGRWHARCSAGPSQPLETAAGQQLAFLATEELQHLFEPAFQDQLAKLKEEREALQQVGEQGSPSGDDIAAVVAAQLRAAKLSQNMLVAEELIYTWCCHQLSCAGIALSGEVEQLSGEGILVAMAEEGALPPLPQPLTQTDLERLLSRAVADAVVGLVASTFSAQASSGVPPSELVTHIDRVQAARLFAGQVEYGYFCAGMEARCRQQGVELGEDSTQLVAFAATLPKEELRAACLVKSAEAWRAAVRHTGRAFGLQPAAQGLEGSAVAAGEEEGGAASSGASPCQQLPYPQLETTASTAQFAPAATLSEYYDRPGAAEAAASAAASRAARGWKQDSADPEPLPPPDLVTMRLGTLQRLLLEGAVLGAVLYRAERAAAEECGFPLTPRGAPPAPQGP